MRLIDADALINRMYHDAFETDSEMQKWDSGCWIRYKMFENAIDEAPTIEPKQGGWIYHADGEGNIDTVQCDICGGWVDITIPEQIAKFDYCPYCGADMRKGASK